jgi:hypothetical protein
MALGKSGASIEQAVDGRSAAEIENTIDRQPVLRRQLRRIDKG